MTEQSAETDHIAAALRGATKPGMFAHLTERAAVALSPAWIEAMAGAVLPLMTQAKAEALREAADLLMAECSSVAAPCFCSSAPWLRDRADALEQRNPPEGSH